MKSSLNILFLLLGLSAMPCSAQIAANGKVTAVHCKGLRRYKESQVLPVINIPIGTVFDQTRAEEATQKLGASGAFDEVRYSYRQIKGGIEVEFQLKESVRFRRCTFDNFPFASDPEILDFIQARVPLYDGSAPDAGNMLDEISAGLEPSRRASWLRRRTFRTPS
jgi:outer membrane protein assembly factor BamA